NHPRRPLSSLKRTPGGHGLLGRSHAPIKPRQTSPAGDERHSENQSGPRADSAKPSQLAAGPRLTPPPDATRPNPNSKRKAASLGRDLVHGRATVGESSLAKIRQ